MIIPIRARLRLRFCVRMAAHRGLRPRLRSLTTNPPNASVRRFCRLVPPRARGARAVVLLSSRPSEASGGICGEGRFGLPKSRPIDPSTRTLQVLGRDDILAGLARRIRHHVNSRPSRRLVTAKPKAELDLRFRARTDPDPNSSFVLLRSAWCHPSHCLDLSRPILAAPLGQTMRRVAPVPSKR